MSETNAVAKRSQFSPEVEARLAENKAKNAVAAQIRGQMWAKDATPETVRAVAEYCRANNLDPVRHVELLGGRVYLTATLYEERAAPLIQRGILIPEEPDHINADTRLDALAKAGNEWAIKENERRMRLRIEHNVPEKAAAVVVQRIRIAATGKTVVGVNWCGGGVRQRDPVGDSEPTKTAITRAARRAWKQVAEAVPTFGEQFVTLERAAEVTGEMILSAEVSRPQLASGPTGGYAPSIDYEDANTNAPRYHGADLTPIVVDESAEAKARALSVARGVAATSDPYDSEEAA